MKSLEETAVLMISEDFKERLVAEYYQLDTRYHNLKEYLTKDDSNQDAKHLKLMFKQLKYMKKYRKVLKSRIDLLKIELTK